MRIMHIVDLFNILIGVQHMWMCCKMKLQSSLVITRWLGSTTSDRVVREVH